MEAAKERQPRYTGKARQARLREAKVSTTGPEARLMKMPDGRIRPDNNVQLATGVASPVIFGVAVINPPQADQKEGLAMEEQVAQRTGHQLGAHLVDGRFVDLEDIRTIGAGWAPGLLATQGAEGLSGGALDAWH